jgi:hypothetical protein
MAPEHALSVSPVKIFVSYAGSHHESAKQIVDHLRQITGCRPWMADESTVPAGTEFWEGEGGILPQLKEAHIVLLLLSPDFEESKWCRHEKKIAIAQMQAHRAVVIPIRAAPVKDKRLAKLSGIPRSTNAVVSLPLAEDHLREIEEEVKQSVQLLRLEQNMPVMDAPVFGRFNMIREIGRRRKNPVVLTGLQGSGKRATALKFAGFFGCRIIWEFRATNFEQQRSELAARLGIAEDKNADWHEIGEQLKLRLRWLLLFHEVPQPAQASQALPRNGYVIITSSRRGQAFGEEIPIEPLTPMRSLILLIHYSGRRRQLRTWKTNEKWRSEMEAAKQIVDYFGRHAGALQAAGKWIRTNGDDFEFYLKQLLKEGPRDLAWQYDLSTLREHSQLILRILAFAPPDYAVPETVFLRRIGVLPALLQSSELDEAARELFQVNFVERDGGRMRLAPIVRRHVQSEIWRDPKARHRVEQACSRLVELPAPMRAEAFLDAGEFLWKLGESDAASGILRAGSAYADDIPKLKSDFEQLLDKAETYPEASGEIRVPLPVDLQAVVLANWNAAAKTPSDSAKWVALFAFLPEHRACREELATRLASAPEPFRKFPEGAWVQLLDASQGLLHPDGDCAHMSPDTAEIIRNKIPIEYCDALEAAIRYVHALYEATLSEDPSERRFKRISADRAFTLYEVGKTYRRIGNLARARQLLEQSVEYAIEAFGDQDPIFQRYNLALAGVLDSLGSQDARAIRDGVAS